VENPHSLTLKQIVQPQVRKQQAMAQLRLVMVPMLMVQIAL